MKVDLSKNYHLLNGADLAYIGDAYYELEIRKYLLSCGITKNKELKEKSVSFVSAHAHQVIYNGLMEVFTEEENNIFKRGRNGAPLNHRKNLNMQEYFVSSGFEAVIGYLYLKSDFERLNFLIKKAISIIEGE